MKSHLDKEELSFEEKQFYIEKMIQVSEQVDKKDSENKQYNWKLVKTAGGAAAFVITAGAALLGGKGSFNLPKR